MHTSKVVFQRTNKVQLNRSIGKRSPGCQKKGHPPVTDNMVTSVDVCPVLKTYKP